MLNANGPYRVSGHRSETLQNQFFLWVTSPFPSLHILCLEWILCFAFLGDKDQLEEVFLWQVFFYHMLWTESIAFFYRTTYSTYIQYAIYSAYTYI
jgi:hypothetical protein